MLILVTCDASEQEDAKPATTSPATGRSPAIKGILKTTTAAASEAPSTPTTKTQAVVTLGGAVTGSPDTKRRFVLKKQLSFETDDPASVPRRGPSPPPLSETQRPPPPAADDLEGQGSAATRTPKVKNKAIARRLMLRDRRSVDDETMTLFPGDDQSSCDVR